MNLNYYLDAVSSVLNAFLCFQFGKSLFTKEEKHDLLFYTATICVVIAKIGIIFFHIPLLNLISSCIMIPMILKCSHKCSISSLFAYSAIVMFLTLTSDVCSNALVSIVNRQTISYTVSESNLSLYRHGLDWLMQIILMRITIILLRKKQTSSNKWSEILLYTLLIGFETGTFIFVSVTAKNNRYGFYVFFLMIGYFILDLYIILLLSKLASSRIAEQELQLMHQQSEMQLQMYSALQNKYELSRSVAHDIEKHIRSLKLLTENASKQQSDAYITDLRTIAKRLNPTFQNQNTMLAIILNTVKERASKEEITIDLEINDFSLKFMRDMDITTLFSNLFDNAIEACSQLPIESRKINFILRKKLNLVILRISNPCITEEKEVVFGIGLKNVQEVVNKYNGVMEIDVENDVFNAAITICLDEEVE